ncbi:glycosyltransferase family 2 protein [Saccharibacillus alkalitolerans]|uniref:Glycosyltransferase family 2 protein n=1 Tax=Saccharibacillus alkalitolerans TaxID=2705290 RepID=A0ABX0F898_9BACL|nr:glycosyltransferase [Saccharibacillus alkalitolerans]NGZ77176.1 glycosyltransferase family 2 protein [Saccharibacillus alkalitolerans]
MQNESPAVDKSPPPARSKLYLPLKGKFYLSHGLATTWMLFSIVLSVAWVNDLGSIITLPAAILIIIGLSYIPGYTNAFMVSSLLLDRQPPLKESYPYDPVTILVACYNEEAGIADTLRYISTQDYTGEVNVIVIDNNSTDRTAAVAENVAEELGMRLKVIFEASPGKNHALNSALAYVETELMLTLDADTLLHKKALRHIVARFKSSPSDVCAVAGAVLVRNSRGNFLAKIQEWDYFLGIASIKRLQGLFQGTLVAQGAFSLYKTDRVREVEGWPDAIGEDIVLTWRFLGKGWKVYFEPLAVAFTEVPESLYHFFRQRSRWARGMIEALKVVKPWQQPSPYTKYLTFCNLVMPYLDFIYTFVWLPGLIMAFFGHYWVVGLTTLLVLPLTFAANFILYTYQKRVFKTLNLRVRKNALGFVAYILLYQIIMSPVSVWGYIQEALKLNRVWK